jgi:LytR cell envelope-related transcriptional attenuator/LytR_cpsA_psr family
MTVVSSDQRPTGDEPDAEPDTSIGLELPEVRRRRELPSLRVPGFLKRATWRFYLFTPLLMVLVLAVPLLSWKGFQILRNEDTGDVIETATGNPDEPGYQALVNGTPTTVVADIGPDGTLQGVTLITVPSSEEGGGNVIFFPVGTLLEVPLRDPPELAMNALYAELGIDALEQRLETMLGAAVDEVVEVPRAQWAELVQPVAPLTVQNPTSVETTNDAGNPVSFPAGEIQLSAEQVGLYLQADSPEEADPVRIARHEAFWTAWLAALDEAGESAVPGEGETGVGGIVRGLIGGPRNFETLPATPVAIPNVPAIESDVFRPNTLEVVAKVPTWIPFPKGVGRLRTRLVMGVEGQTDQIADIAHTLVVAGSEIAVIANAEEWGEDQTQVVYFRDEQREQAQRLLDALGTGVLIKDSAPGDNFDVVVVIGQDFIDAGGGDEPAGSVPGSVPTEADPSSGGLPENGIQPGEPGGEPTG